MFYFFIITSVTVSGGSTLWDENVGIMSVVFIGTSVIHSLISVYWNLNYHDNTLSLFSLKLYSGFKRSSYEYLFSFGFCNSHKFKFTVCTKHKIILTTMTSMLSISI